MVYTAEQRAAAHHLAVAYDGLERAVEAINQARGYDRTVPQLAVSAPLLEVQDLVAERGGIASTHPLALAHPQLVGPGQAGSRS